jgi:hypothetical protein
MRIFIFLFGFFLYFSSQIALAADSSRITIYVYPASGNLKWETPKKLVSSFFDLTAKAALTMNYDVPLLNDFGEKNYLSSHYASTMGHTIAHTQCRLKNGKWFDKWASLSGMDDAALVAKKIFNEGLGAGAVFYDYKDGHIMTGEENWKRLAFYYGAAVKESVDKSFHLRPRYIEFEIDRNDCDELEKMISFFESYHFPLGTPYAKLEKKDPESVLYFTPSYMPYESYLNRIKTGHGKVGGGCAAFGAGLLKAAGKYDPEFDSWMRPVTVSERLIGGTIAPNGKPRFVKVTDILWTDLGNHWVYSGIPNREVSYYDPALVWNFIGKAMKCLKPGKSCEGDVDTWLRSRGSRIRNGPTQVISGTTKKNAKNPVKKTQRIDGIVVEM